MIVLLDKLGCSKPHMLHILHTAHRRFQVCLSQDLFEEHDSESLERPSAEIERIERTVAHYETGAFSRKWRATHPMCLPCVILAPSRVRQTVNHS
jgi:hypothetical protein